MSAPRWTPGPWLLDPNMRADGVPLPGFQVSSATGSDVAEVYSQATARLIAAAPDLYRALDTALVTMKLAQALLDGAEYDFEPAIAEVIAARAKARGET